MRWLREFGNSIWLNSILPVPSLIRQFTVTPTYFSQELQLYVLVTKPQSASSSPVAPKPRKMGGLFEIFTNQSKRTSCFGCDTKSYRCCIYSMDSVIFLEVEKSLFIPNFRMT